MDNGQVVIIVYSASCSSLRQASDVMVILVVITNEIITTQIYILYDQ